MSLLTTMLESVGALYRPTIGRDTAQGVTQGPFVLIADNIPCSAQQASTSVVNLYAQRNTSVSTVLYFGQNPGVQVNDQLRVVDRTGAETYYLVRGQAQSVGYGILWQADADYIDQPP